MLENLFARVDALIERNNGEDVEVHRESVARAESELRIQVRLIPDMCGGVDLESEHWEISCRGVLRDRLPHFPEWDGYLEWAADHPLLWEFREKTLELYFHGVPSDVHALLGRLWARHNALAGSWLTFGECLNASGEHLPGGYGLLAHGPESLMRAYGSVEAAGVMPVFLEAYRRVAPSVDASVILLGGDYVIASEFDARECGPRAR